MEHSAPRRPVRSANLPAVNFDDRSANSETEACTTILFRAGTEEFFEDALLGSSWNSRAVVGDLDDQGVAFFASADIDSRLRTRILSDVFK